MNTFFITYGILQVGVLIWWTKLMVTKKRYRNGRRNYNQFLVGGKHDLIMYSFLALMISWVITLTIYVIQTWTN